MPSAALAYAPAPVRESDAKDRRSAMKEEVESLEDANSVGRADVERRAPGGAGSGVLAAKKSAPAELPGFTLRLKSDKEKGTADILSGLKAMGAVNVSAPRTGDGRYVFRVPPSMLKEIDPYLERYGNVERMGSLPGSPSGESPGAPVEIFLRLLPPASK